MLIGERGENPFVTIKAKEKREQLLKKKKRKAEDSLDLHSEHEHTSYQDTEEERNQHEEQHLTAKR